jgi:hypothetical protein
MASESDMKDQATYQGSIDRDLWEDFKRHVPRTINLDEKINELIRDWTKEQEEREQRLAELENEQK